MPDTSQPSNEKPSVVVEAITSLLPQESSPQPDVGKPASAEQTDSVLLDSQERLSDSPSIGRIQDRPSVRQEVQPVKPAVIQLEKADPGFIKGSDLEVEITQNQKPQG